MEQKFNIESNFDCEINILKSYKDIHSGDWILTGIAASVGEDNNVPIYVLTPEVMRKAASSVLTYGVLLYDHDPHRAIGKIISSEYNEKLQGIVITAVISKTASDIWQQCEEGVLKCLSIGGKVLGYIEKLSGKTMDLIREVTDLVINEVSLTPLSANVRTKILSVEIAKSYQKNDKNKIETNGGSTMTLLEIQAAEQEEKKLAEKVSNSPEFLEISKSLDEVIQKSAKIDSSKNQGLSPVKEKDQSNDKKAGSNQGQPDPEKPEPTVEDKGKNQGMKPVELPAEVYKKKDGDNAVVDPELNPSENKGEINGQKLEEDKIEKKKKDDKSPVVADMSVQKNNEVIPPGDYIDNSLCGDGKHCHHVDLGNTIEKISGLTDPQEIKNSLCKVSKALKTGMYCNKSLDSSKFNIPKLPEGFPDNKIVADPNTVTSVTSSLDTGDKVTKSLDTSKVEDKNKKEIEVVKPIEVTKSMNDVVSLIQDLKKSMLTEQLVKEILANELAKIPATDVEIKKGLALVTEEITSKKEAEIQKSKTIEEKMKEVLSQLAEVE